MVIRMPPGSLPGMISFAIAPTMRPVRTTPRMLMYASLSEGGGAGPVPCVWARKGGVFTRDPESSRAPFLPQCGESARPRPLAPRGSLLELLQSLLDRLEALLQLLPPLPLEPSPAAVVRP